MTHKDIYIKFMIEYDKANVTSSYPSLTEYEVATVLDKAYNALIAQKVTGNNIRRATFESDIKSIADLSPLVKTINVDIQDNSNDLNMFVCELPEDLLYFLKGSLYYHSNIKHGEENIISDDDYDKYGKSQYKPLDKYITRNMPVKLVSHEIADSFLVTSNNMPWVKQPVCYIENNATDPSIMNAYIIYDPLDPPCNDVFDVTYIKQPQAFTKNLNEYSGTTSYFMGSGGNVEFELNSTMAEELISLAISFALENVESPRLNTKLNMRGLES